jgi:hypothetical protein
MKTLNSALILSLLFSLHAFAAEAPKPGPHPENDADQRQCDHCDRGDDEYRRPHPRMVLSISPRYYSLNSDGYSSSFVNAGLNAVPKGAVGGDISLYVLTANSWQLGIAGGTVSYEGDTGSNLGEFNSGYFGVWLGKTLASGDHFGISLGTVIGMSQSHFEVLSSGANGRTEEQAFIVQPKLTIDYRIASRVKVGISGAYLEPISPTQNVRGQDLTTGSITLHGASVGVEFMLTSFGGEADHEQSK